MERGATILEGGENVRVNRLRRARPGMQLEPEMLEVVVVVDGA
jgi:hypothetical protein